MSDNNSDSPGMATVGLQIGQQVLGIVGKLLAQHTLRLHDAQTENSEVAQLIPALVQDAQEIVAALNAGQIDANSAIQSLAGLDTYIKGRLQSYVGKPGTAWSGSPSGCPDGSSGMNGSHSCNKQCTVGCCIYYNFFEPFLDCLIRRIAKGGVQAAALAPINGNKYGFPSFPGVVLHINPPANGGILSSGEGLVSGLEAIFGGGGSQIPGGGTVQASGSVAISSGNPTLLYVGLGALALFALVALRK